MGRLARRLLLRRRRRELVVEVVVTLADGDERGDPVVLRRMLVVERCLTAKFYQWDPTKLFIRTASLLGLASQLKTFPDNEIRRG
jgi:hypothetical protein